MLKKLWAFIKNNIDKIDSKIKSSRVNKWLGKNFYTEYYLHRHTLINIIVILILSIIILQVFFISKPITPSNKEKDKDKVKITVQKGYIFDRNGLTMAGDIPITDIVVDPISGIKSIGTNGIYAIFRINKTCKPKTNAKYKELAKQAKSLYKQKKTANKCLTSINLLKEFIDIIQVNNSVKMLSFLEANAKRCAYKKLRKEELTKEIKASGITDKDKIEAIINKKLANIPCIVNRTFKKTVRINDNIMKNLQNFSQEEFLICMNTPKKPSGFFLKRWFANDKETMLNHCKAEKVDGIDLTKYIKNKRFYPFAELTTPLIGIPTIGEYGLESMFKQYLTLITTKTAKIKTTQLFKNKLKPQPQLKSIKPKNLYLTIDSKIQFYLLNAIKKAVGKHKAKNGAGIIVNKQGAILAAVSYPTSSANETVNGVDEFSHYMNRPFSDNIDIASIIKPLIMATALEEKVITKDSIIDVSKSEGSQFRARKNLPFISLGEIIERSYSLGSIKIGKKIDNVTLWQYLSTLGFGKSVEAIPVANNGFLRSPYEWSSVDKKRLSFGGYGVISTNLAQIARAYLIFLNNGKIRNLKLIKGTKDKTQKVFSKATIDFMISAMERTFYGKHGTARRSKLSTVRAAGKTGTAQLLVNGRYSANKHNTLFAGFAPSKNAKYLMIVDIYDPKVRGHSGGKMAAPVFKEVMDRLLDPNQ